METTLSGFAKNLSFHFSAIFIHSLFTRALIFPIGTALHYAFEGLFSFYVHIIQFSSSSSASPITLFRIFSWSPPSVSWLEPGHLLSFLGALVVKNPPANTGNIRDMSLVPGSGRSPGRGHGNPLQDSCLENPMDRGAWWAAVHGITKSQTQLK